MTTVPGSCSWGLYDYCTGKKLHVRKKQRISLYVKKNICYVKHPNVIHKKKLVCSLTIPKILGASFHLYVVVSV